MFSETLDKDKNKLDVEKHLEMSKRISKMNLTEMKSYVSNKITSFEVCENGLIAVMQRLVLEDDETSKLYLQSDDMDSKIKKAFDLVISISTNKKITLTVIELIQQFTEVYADIIAKYDKDNKDIYKSRLKDAIEKGIKLIGELSKIKMELRFKK